MKKWKIITLLLFGLTINSCLNSEDPLKEIETIIQTFEKKESPKKYQDSSLLDNPRLIIYIPGMGEFELDDMKKDSVHEYGGGDCSGKVEQYSYDHVSLILDSLHCYEYGQEYTHYLLTENKEIQVVHVVDYKSYFVSEIDDHINVWKEKIFDFNTEPARYLIRQDSSVKKLEELVKNMFVEEVLENPTLMLEEWNLELQQLWKNDLLE